MKFKKYIIGIGSAVVIELIKDVIVSWVHSIDLKSAFVYSWNKIIEFIFNILNFPIPIWGILIAIVILYIVLRLYYKITETNIEDQSWYKDYSNGRYNGLMYEWQYDRIGNIIEMKNVIPICEDCMGNVLPKENGYKEMLYCPNCNKNYKKPNKEEYDSAKTYFNNKLKKIIKEHNEKQKTDCKK